MQPAAIGFAAILALAARDGAGDASASAQALDGRPELHASAAEVAGHTAFERGLAYLASQQRLRRDGSLPAGSGENAAPIGVTSLGALAFLAGGSLPGRGPYGEAVERAIDYLLAHVAPPDHDHAGYVSDERDHKSQTHGHGLATLALAQAYTLSSDTVRGRRIADALRAAVRRIEVSQGLEGGWYYDPVRSVEHEGSVTVCLVQGLRAAKGAGVRVDPDVIARAIDYVRRLQDESGGFRYGLHEHRTTPALTAACLSTLHATGIYEGPEIESGYDYLWRELTARETGLGGELAAYPYYERFYLSQSLWQHPDEDVFRDWFQKERERVLIAQRPDGSWADARFGSSYATAMNCLFLALPEGLLPIFQR